MGYVDQGCRNIAFTVDKDGKRLWLSAECRRDDGKWRTSKIDLNKCIGPSSPGSDGRLEALSGYKVVTLTHGGGKGNHNEFRNWQITNGGRTFKCEGQVAPGLAGILPWNWWNDEEWAWCEFDLNEHLNNVNGTLEFWAKKHEAMFPEWLSSTLEIVAKASEDTENLLDKSPLEAALDQMSESMVEQKLAELGWDEKEKKWVRGIKIKDWRIVRLGT